MKRALFALFLLATPAHAQQRSMPPWPDPREWGPEEQRRVLPPRWHDPYSRGPYGPPPPRGIDQEEYERRSFCAMHPRACQ
jgi:hypothetical protein